MAARRAPPAALFRLLALRSLTPGLNTGMARSKPEPDPRPTDGGSYRLDEETGKWIDNYATPTECVMPAPAPAPALDNEQIDA